MLCIKRYYPVTRLRIRLRKPESIAKPVGRQLADCRPPTPVIGIAQRRPAARGAVRQRRTIARVRKIRDALAHAVMGVAGLIFGVLSAGALALAAIVPAALGLLAFLLTPLRALADRLRRLARR
jgi:hypothetical protein